MNFKKLLTLSLLFVASAAFGQDVSKLLDLTKLETKSGYYVKFPTISKKLRKKILTAAQACETVSGAQLKADLKSDLAFFFNDKDAFQADLDLALADDASYQGCRVDVDLVRGPSGPGVDSGTFVYAVIDPATAQEVILGLYAEYP